MMEQLQQILKYKFKNEDLLQKAITHSSVKSNVDSNYERLEFLGDRVLGVAVASLLYRLFPNEPEGNLSQRFVGLVCKETVAEVALHLELDKFIKVISADLHRNENVLCDVCEAVIGAIYIDAGVDAAIEFVDCHWRELIDKNVAPPKDNKTKLQEISHHLGYGTPQYKIIERTGSDHEPMFTVEVSLGNKKTALGHGHSKKMAEFEAAAQLLEKIQ
ncbi:MAG: ribonuclease III [Alphaproteobacteria bacterium]|nr:ribonuclease III [Alphaproteobacteria bacterium]